MSYICERIVAADAGSEQNVITRTKRYTRRRYKSPLHIICVCKSTCYRQPNTVLYIPII